MREQQYLDEQIIRMRRGEQCADTTPLESGVYVGDVFMTFSRVHVADDRLTVVLPDNFVDLPAEMAKLKYPSEERPQIIKSSMDTTVNFTFSWFKQTTLDSSQVEKRIEQYRSLITKINPSVKILKHGVMDREKQRLAWLQYKTTAFDSSIFNVTYFTPINGQMLHGAFNCFFTDRLDWWPVAREVMRSIQDNRQEQNIFTGEKGLV